MHFWGFGVPGLCRGTGRLQARWRSRHFTVATTLGSRAILSQRGLQLTNRNGAISPLGAMCNKIRIAHTQIASDAAMRIISVHFDIEPRGSSDATCLRFRLSLRFGLRCERPRCQIASDVGRAMRTYPTIIVLCDTPELQKTGITGFLDTIARSIARHEEYPCFGSAQRAPVEK